MTFRKSLLGFLLSTLIASHSLADDTCLECKNTTPNPDVLTNSASGYKPDFDDTTWMYCSVFGQKTANTVGYYLKTELQNAPYYSIEDYFQRAGCRVEEYGGDVKAPLLHMVADYPVSRHDFAEIVYIYYTKRRKSPDLWLKAVNAKNTKGETLLDYIELKIRSGRYSVESVLNAAKSIQKFACEHGGVYSKYSDQKCP